MKEFLQNLIKNKEARANELRKLIQDATTADEVRSYGNELTTVENELREAKVQLQQFEARNVTKESSANGFNPSAMVASVQMNQRKSTEEKFGTMEYRMAFKKYVQTGEAIPHELRAGGDTGTTVTTDIGMIIPTTIMNEFIKDVSKVYGQIYSKVRKLNVKGGVEFPISKLSANFKWITETTVSNKQKAGDIKDKVSFSYHIGEIRVAESLLAQVVSLDVFESEIVRIMVEAYVKAMDTAIISGTGSGQPLGITVDTRVTGNTGNIIEFEADEIGDWTAWRKKLFAKVPLAKRGSGEFLFPASTVESNLLTMKDANGRPLFREATDGTVGNLAGTFFGRDVTLVEPDIIKDYDTASTGEIIGIFWTPNDYAINTQLQFGMKRYFDEDTNEWINKALTIVDGKILDVSGCYLLKKKVSG